MTPRPQYGIWIGFFLAGILWTTAAGTHVLQDPVVELHVAFLPPPTMRLQNAVANTDTLLSSIPTLVHFTDFRDTTLRYLRDIQVPTSVQRLLEDEWDTRVAVEHLPGTNILVLHLRLPRNESAAEPARVFAERVAGVAGSTLPDGTRILLDSTLKRRFHSSLLVHDAILGSFGALFCVIALGGFLADITLDIQLTSKGKRRQHSPSENVSSPAVLLSEKPYSPKDWLNVILSGK